MDKVGVEKSVVFTNASGAKFDSLYNLYSKYPDRFDVYCGFDLSGYQEKGWSEKAVKELRRCIDKGAVGVGELHDKGVGLVDGLHPDDPRMDSLFEACAELKYLSICICRIRNGCTRPWILPMMDSCVQGHGG